MEAQPAIGLRPAILLEFAASVQDVKANNKTWKFGLMSLAGGQWANLYMQPMLQFSRPSHKTISRGLPSPNVFAIRIRYVLCTFRTSLK